MNVTLAAFSRLGIALGPGLLDGLQRERTESSLAGFRTFPLTNHIPVISCIVDKSMRLLA